MNDTDSEAVEGAFTRAIGEAAPAGTGARTLTVGTASALALPGESLVFNRVAGFTEPVTGDLIARFAGLFRETGSARATFKFAPSVLPDDWAELSAKHGLTAAPATVKLSRSCASVPASRTDLRVGLVTGDDDYARVLEIMLNAFGDRPPYLAGMLGAMNRHPHSRQFAAWDGDAMVAVGLLFVDGEGGVFKGGVTLPSHRGRGAQSALIAARVAAAREAGCRWVVSETDRPAPGEHNTSLSNMERAGFVQAYDYCNVLLT